MRNKDRYPANWNDTIRPKALEKANYRCSKCNVVHRFCYVFDENGKRYKINKSEIQEYKEAGLKAYQVFLQVAHLDNDPNNNEEENLRVFCAKCHLANDKEYKNLLRKSKLREKEELRVSSIGKNE